MSEVKIKEELSKLDRNDFDQVNILVEQIMEDIKQIIQIDYDMGISVIEDYLFDLINPELLNMENN